MGIKIIPDECSNCGCEIALDEYHECPNCGAPLCGLCTCLCGIEIESKAVEEAFKIEDDSDLITKLEDSVEMVKRKKREKFTLTEGEDEWIEITDKLTNKTKQKYGEDEP